MNKFLTRLAAAGFATLLTAGSALAQAYPTSVIDNWGMRANNTLLSLNITNQSSDSPCAQITGTLGSNPIVGYYCPASGLIGFEVNSVSNGATFQVYSGQMSYASEGTYPTQMTGNFSAYEGGNNTGAYSFWAD
jgi:hypothetical protein